MWLFTKYGFFSVVCARTEEGKTDHDTMMVRSRVKSHLERLKKRFFISLSMYEIKTTKDTDYRYRLVVSMSDWMDIVSELTGEINYSNFKSEVSKSNKTKDKSYEQALHDVWAIMNRLQK